MWIWVQPKALLYRNNVRKGFGYSGRGVAKNDPMSQHLVGLGPIPVGAYNIGEATDSDTHGPVTMHLIPVTGTETYGRSGFLMHGDSMSAPGTASHGCIIVGRVLREEVAASHERLLLVIPELA